MTLTDNNKFGKREKRLWAGINHTTMIVEAKQDAEKLQYDLGKARVIAKYKELL